MKKLTLLALLVLTAFSCKKQETPEPDYYADYQRTYTAKYHRITWSGDPVYIETVQVNLSFIDSIATISFQTNDDLFGDWEHTYDKSETHCDDKGIHIVYVQDDAIHLGTFTRNNKRTSFEIWRRNAEHLIALDISY